jgi:uroporphyrinogen-III synthase
MPEDVLHGRTIAVFETRELEVFSQLLERRGARVRRCPLVGILDAPDPDPVLKWLREFAAGGCDDLILLTGEGLRRLRACIDRHEPSLREPFLTALGRVRRITRGPKPARALREVGLAPDIEAGSPTTAGVIESLKEHDLQGRRVGVQRYGVEPNAPLMEFLAEAGAAALPVAPYVYTEGAADSAVQDLLRDIDSGDIDALAFTSKAQVERLFRVDEPARIQATLSRTQVTAVGPVVAEALQARKIVVNAMPRASWFMKPLATELCALLSGTDAAADR